MDLKEFYLRNIKETDYHYRFYEHIDDENNDFTFEVFDAEEAIVKFKELCDPYAAFDNENKNWFYLITYYLHTLGYVIKEFPRILARPPIEPGEFTYGDIRNRLIALGKDSNGTVRYATRRSFVAELHFELKSIHLDIDDSLNQKFAEISNRQASFNDMSTDEKLAEIANLIESLLKKNGKFLSLDYSTICFDYIDNNMIVDYRKKLHCFRHATTEAITERNSYSEQQKNFLVDYGLIIIKTINILVEKMRTQI